MKKRPVMTTLILLLIMALPLAAVAAGLGTIDFSDAALDFSNDNPTSGASGGPFTISTTGLSDRDVTFTLTGTDVFSNVNRFDTNSQTYLRVRSVISAPVTSVYTLTVNFDQPVTDVQFNLTNFDDRSGSNRVTQATITTDGVNPTLTASDPTFVNIVGQTATAINGSVDQSVGVDIPAGNAIQNIFIVFSNGDTDTTERAGGTIDYEVQNIAFTPSTPTAVTMSNSGITTSNSMLVALLVAAVLTVLTAGWVTINRRQEI